MPFKINPFTGEFDETGPGGTPGGGDVSGPVSSTDNDIAVFDGTTGKLLKDTGISSIAPIFQGDVETLGNFNLPQTVPTVGKINMDGIRYMHSGGSASNTFLGSQSGSLTNSSVGSTGIGQMALSSLTSGISNTAVGHVSLDSLETGNFNTAIGEGAMFQCGSGVLGNTAIGWHALIICQGDNNTALGYQTLAGGVSGDNNIGIGYQSLVGLTSGSNNICLGALSGANYTASETNNICLNNPGVASDNNTTRIGSSSTTRAFLYGIEGIALSSNNVVVMDPTTSQAGTLPGSPQVAIQSSVLNMLGGGIRPIFTPQRNFIVTAVMSVTVAETGMNGDSLTSLGFNSPAYDNVNAGGISFPTNLTESNATTLDSTNPFVPAGSLLQINMTNPDSGATVFDAQVYVVGFYM